MKITHRRIVSLTTSRTRTLGLQQGTVLVPLGAELPVVGFWHQGGRLTAYVAGTMPPHMRTACEQGCTDEEHWFGAMPAGIQEIDLTDCRYDYLVQQPAKVLPMYPTQGEFSDVEQAA